MVNRRSFMRTTLDAAAGLMGLSGCTANSVTVSNFKTVGPGESISREKPNIIFILADHGYGLYSQAARQNTVILG